jgi:hypothetical protein
MDQVQGVGYGVKYNPRPAEYACALAYGTGKACLAAFDNAFFTAALFNHLIFAPFKDIYHMNSLACTRKGTCAR